MQRICVLILAVIAVVSSCGYHSKLHPIAEKDRAELKAWLDEHGRSPEEYIASKFSDHDIVFIGEYHRIKHDPILVQNVISVIYRNGVCNLGLEFIAARDQALVDSLLAGDVYDCELANRIFWNC